ncbi:MAG: TonB-dependent receptor plug domain-containing protein, partial [Bacteroidota bacterium]
MLHLIIKMLRVISLFTLPFFVFNLSYAQEKDEELLALMNLSLEELISQQITSVSKKAEKLQTLPNAIYVLSAEDIMQSSATNMIELLRMVPGFWGTQDEYGSGVYPSIRNSRSDIDLNGTVLVLLDGTPLQDLISSIFSYRNFDLPMDEIERIEVIRGSGGTIYGANSATGVINIITKSPGDYDGIFVRMDVATPGYTNTTLRAGGTISEKVSISGYAKHRYFNGFGDFAGLDENGDELPQGSRFDPDYETSHMISLGFKSDIELSDRSRLSLKTHFNTLSKIDYTNVYPPSTFDILSASYLRDSLIENDVDTRRFIGNLQYDYAFSDNHSFFARVSTNMEKEFNKQGGGYWSDNRIIDFEFQDNLTISGINDVSFGANYRIVQYNIFDINDDATFGFVNPQGTESLKGAFVQNRLKLLQDKLHLIVGIKTENYSLINDTYYLSPMAKFSYTPVKNVTVWGGFTQSFTTPGLLNTNSEVFAFQPPARSEWEEIVTLGVFQEAFQGALASGADEATAQAIAQGFVASSDGQALVQSQTNQFLASNPETGVRNGSNTRPSRFRNWEAGFRSKITDRLYVEGSFFYSNVIDMVGIALFPGAFEVAPSISQPDRNARFLPYGNYLKGTSKGLELLSRYQPNNQLEIELSYSYLSSEWQYQENDDFDLSFVPTELSDQTPTPQYIPQHIIRAKVSYNLPGLFKANLRLIRTSIFNTFDGYSFEQERYANPLGLPETGTDFTRIAVSDERLIVNIRFEKSLASDRLDAYIFGNDVFNRGIVAGTFGSTAVT